MAERIPDRDIATVLSAAKEWLSRCLIEDGSVFSDRALWTSGLVAEIHKAFIESLDAGPDDFITKLKRQMTEVSPDGQRLMAEMMWILLLFPSNLKTTTKRDHVRTVWGLSGTELDESHRLLADDVLQGVGSGGPGFNNHRWRELSFLLDVTSNLKGKPSIERHTALTDYDAFFTWIQLVPQTGHRQFRHMLRYFAFPGRVERMSSNGHRRAVLVAFGIAAKATVKRWGDRELDDALLRLRQDQETKHPGQVLDFYFEPLRHVWRGDEDVPGEAAEEEPAQFLREGPALPDRPDAPVNLILYGPPGTGKTYWLQKKMAEYTDRADGVDRDTWIQDLVSRFGWRPIIATALDQMRRAVRVPELWDHPLIRAKARQRGRTGASTRATLWGFLQEHTPETVTTVSVATRRAPYIFTKNEQAEWSLVDDWPDLDDEAAELKQLLAQGQGGTTEPVRRYRTVTFHPSFGYEDFIRGIRPVALAELGSTEFRMVDGIFKQLCDEARANPRRRYALFIDEINRANIAKVFGELITLIEVDKRATFDAEGRPIGGMTVSLAGGDDGAYAFGVPDNLDIYGTMNTADRSIALLDVALRRRFVFSEIEPDYGLLNRSIGRIHLGHFLNVVNDRLEYLIDRDHRIGHAYVMSVGNLAELRTVVAQQVLPLLQEFFFDDFSRVALVLATHLDAPPFIQERRLTASDLFPEPREALPAERSTYVITPPSHWTEDSFVGVYSEEVLAADGD